MHNLAAGNTHFNWDFLNLLSMHDFAAYDFDEIMFSKLVQHS